MKLIILNSVPMKFQTPRIPTANRTGSEGCKLALEKRLEPA